MELCENQVNVIAVESPEVLTTYISELKRQISGEEGQFVLSDKDVCRIDKMMEIIIVLEATLTERIDCETIVIIDADKCVIHI